MKRQHERRSPTAGARKPGQDPRVAAHLFALQGDHETIDEVLAVARATKGAFFHHLCGREDLGFAVLDWHM